MGNNGHGFYANNPDVNVNQPTVVGFGVPGRAVEKSNGDPTLRDTAGRRIFPSSEMMRPAYYDALQAKLDKRFN